MAMILPFHTEKVKIDSCCPKEPYNYFRYHLLSQPTLKVWRVPPGLGLELLHGYSGLVGEMKYYI